MPKEDEEVERWGTDADASPPSSFSSDTDAYASSLFLLITDVEIDTNKVNYHVATIIEIIFFTYYFRVIHIRIIFFDGKIDNVKVNEIRYFTFIIIIFLI